MNRLEAEKLLGGYAAGILTDSEKQTLFSAALEHQELFDALVDEEALRELLADPAIRQRLLALLSEPVKAVPLWRRPAVLGLAASLFTLVTTTVLLRMREREPRFEAAQEAVKEGDVHRLEAQPVPAPNEGESLPVRTREPARATVKETPRRSRPKEPAKVAMAPSAEEAVPETLVGAKKSEVPEDASFNRSPSAAAGDTLSAGLGSTRVEPAAPAPKAMRSDERQSHGFKAKSAAEGPGLPPPVCRVRLEDGSIRLTVVASPVGHLYVLKRSPTGVSVLKPLRTKADKAGVTSLFEYGAAERGSVEVYLLAGPVPDPAALPAEGGVDGHRWKESVPE